MKPSATLNPRSGKAGTLERNFWPRIQKTEGCWLWMGWTIRRGYGQITLAKKRILTHRLSYTLAYGEIPEGMLVCHKCDTPRCVNPSHLFLGTPLDNARDMVAKGRGRKAHCKRGHEFTPENTRIDVKGYNICRTCSKDTRNARAKKLRQS
jgi:hypothetical protein